MLHKAGTDSRLVNDAVGFLLHSSLVTPYFSWAITHAKHHHYTNHMTMGETWVPSTANPAKQSVEAAKTPAGTAKRIAGTPPHIPITEGGGRLLQFFWRKWYFIPKRPLAFFF